VVAAGLTSVALVGNYTYFGTNASMLQHGFDWLAVPACGVVGGLLGGAFSRAVTVMARGFPGVLGQSIKNHPLAFAFVCGLGVALCGLASGNTVFGTGYVQVKDAIENGTPLPVSFGLLKLAATALSTVAGLPGGIFSPSLAVGAGLGANVAHFFPHAPIGAIILLGMVSYFAGVAQAPITAFVIVTEMTENHNMVLPVMVASLIGYATSRLICQEGIYHALAKGFVQRELARAAATTGAAPR
jgi:H+/Cl- antiporter ClcA